MKPFRWFALLFAPLAALAAAPVSQVAPAEAARLVSEEHAVLIDVREPDEWKETGAAAPAVLLPKSDFDGEKSQWKPFLEKHRDQTLVLYCRSGHRAGLVAKSLEKEGYKVVNAGGFADWKKAGLPVRPVSP